MFVSLLLVAEWMLLLAVFAVSAEALARGTEHLQELFGQGMAGGVVLGLLNSMPESIIVVVAVLNGRYDVAIGSALGGNLMLFTVGVGSIAILYAMRWKTDIRMSGDYMVELKFLLLSTVAMAAVVAYGRLDILSGAALMLVYLAYVALRYSRMDRKLRLHAGDGPRLLRAVGYLAFGTAVALLFSGTVVDVIGQLSAQAGIPALWISLMVVPIISDLDDNLSAYRLAVRSRGGGSTSIVSFVGAKIQNNTLLLGFVGLLAAAPVGLSGAVPQFALVILMNLAAVLVMRTGRLGKRVGALLIALYFIVGYLALAH